MATDTRYGLVDTAVLERLREEFDTRSILDAVDKIDEIRYHIDSVRDELLKLHSMAHDLINGAGSGDSAPEQPIWELSEEISMTIWEWSDQLETVRETMDQLTALTPDPDEEIEI